MTVSLRLDSISEFQIPAYWYYCIGSSFLNSIFHIFVLLLIKWLPMYEKELFFQKHGYIYGNKLFPGDMDPKNNFAFFKYYYHMHWVETFTTNMIQIINMISQKVACVAALNTSTMLSSCWCCVLTPQSRALFFRITMRQQSKKRKKLTAVQVLVIYFTVLFLFIFNSFVLSSCSLHRNERNFFVFPFWIRV